MTAAGPPLPPLPAVDPVLWARAPRRAFVRFVSANFDFNADADYVYLKWLRGRYTPFVLAMQEREHGLSGTRVRGVGVKVSGKTRRVLGRIGSHRAVASGWVDVDGRRTRVLSVHGLHGRTVGRAAQYVLMRLLAAWCARMTRRGVAWVVCGDFNLHYVEVARLLGGRGVGSGVDGVIVSPLLDVELEGVDETATTRTRRWSDHPAIVARVSRRPEGLPAPFPRRP